MSRFGEFVRNRRAHLGMSLRAFSIKHGVDPSNWSKMERGRLQPPSGEKLEQYASFLGLDEGTDDWREFCDRAYAARGEIPEDLRDEKLLAKLPVLFRTLRGKDGVDDGTEAIDKLMSKLQDSL